MNDDEDTCLLACAAQRLLAWSDVEVGAVKPYQAEKARVVSTRQSSSARV